LSKIKYGVPTLTTKHIKNGRFKQLNILILFFINIAMQQNANINYYIFENMIGKVKQKIQSDSSTRTEKVQVLTISPDSQSRTKVSKVFQLVNQW